VSNFGYNYRDKGMAESDLEGKDYIKYFLFCFLFLGKETKFSQGAIV
jgi:hypothetical protein